MPFLVGSSSKATIYMTLPGGTKVSFDLPFRSESINPRANSITSEAILGNRAVSGATITSRTFQGSVDLELFDVTASGATPTFKHHLLGALMYLILGNFSSGTVSLGSVVPKIDYLVVNHGGATGRLQWKDLYVTGLNLRFPSDGIPTATLDVLATNTDSSTISGYTSVLTAAGYSNYYTPANLALKLGSTSYTAMIRNLEVSLSMNTLQATAWGSLDVVEVSPGLLEMAQVSIEFYTDSFTDGLFNALNSVYNSGAISSSSLVIEIDSPTNSGNKATMTFGNFYVTEMTHDISGNDYIVCRATLQVPASKITLGGIAFKTT